MRARTEIVLPSGTRKAIRRPSDSTEPLRAAFVVVKG